MSHIRKRVTSLLVLRRYEHQFLFLFKCSRDVVTGLLILTDICHFNHTFLHAHVEAHTHKHTFIISTQEERREPGIGAWLGGVEEGFLSETKAQHTHTHTHTHMLYRAIYLMQESTCCQSEQFCCLSFYSKV